MALTTEEKAKRLMEADRARLGSILCSKMGLAMRWERASDADKTLYYVAVAQGDYEIEFEEDNND